ncbi:MAG: hypothetical protein ACREGI_00355 [Candidatus Levyibacteriota bacterium]
MKHKLARFISLAFHPIIFAIIMPFFVVYKETTNVLYGLEWTGFSLLFLIFALIAFFLVRPKEFLSDFDISKKEQRHIFYSISALTAILYFITALIFKGVFFPLSIVAIGILLGIVIFDICTYYMKISIHTAVIAAFVVTEGMAYGFMPFLIVVWILPLMVWSRVSMKKHTIYEAIAGIVVGSLITFLTFFIAKILYVE